MDDIIIRKNKAREISNRICLDILDTYKASELSEWHSFRLVNLYVSSRDNTEITIQLNRGFKSDINLDIDIVPDESIDRLSDRLIDTIRTNLKKYVIQDDDLNIEFDNNEYVSSVNISTIVNRNEDTYSEPEYTVSFDTENRDEVIVSDYKLHGNPRINGKRILVSDIYNKYNQLGDYEGLETICDMMNNLVSRDEVEKAVEFAKNSDEIDDITENNKNVDVSDANNLEDLVDSSEKELDTFEDNR